MYIPIKMFEGVIKAAFERSEQRTIIIYIHRVAEYFEIARCVNIIFTV